MRTIKVLYDFGERGITASGFNLDYRDIWDYILDDRVENSLALSWADSLKKNPKMQNKKLFNYKRTGVVPDVAVTSVGSSTFRDYNEMRQFLDGTKDPKTYGLTEDGIAWLEKEVHVLSTFPAVRVEDCILMGKKGWQVMEAGAGKISFPGAGYLQVDKETFIFEGHRYARQLQQIVRRELEEETGIKEYEMPRVSVLGIAEDTFKGSHRNPAVFSIVDTDLSIEKLMNRKNIAVDAWEHQGPFILLPTGEPELLEAYIASDTNNLSQPLPEKYATKIPGLSGKKQIDTTGKSEFMLYWLGRFLYGSSWLKEVLERQSPVITIHK